jgi:hypothetical protein
MRVDHDFVLQLGHTPAGCKSICLRDLNPYSPCEIRGHARFVEWRTALRQALDALIDSDTSVADLVIRSNDELDTALAWCVASSAALRVPGLADAEHAWLLEQVCQIKDKAAGRAQKPGKVHK